MKMQKWKKSFMSLGLALSLALPLTSVVSCGSKPKKTLDKNNAKNILMNYKLSDIKPLDFNDIFNTSTHKQSEPTFLRGINYTAYAYGLSFFLNVLRSLGWNWEDKSKVDDLYNDGFDFSVVNPLTAPGSNMDKEAPATKLEKKIEAAFRDNYANGLAQFINQKATDPLVTIPLYKQIKTLVYVRKGANANKADARTETTVDLGNDFSRLDDNKKMRRIANKLNYKFVAQKLFQNKKYAYAWGGGILSKLGFQIQKNTLLLWQVSDELPEIVKNLKQIRDKTKKMEELINLAPLSLPSDQKNLNQVFLDPFGIDGTMSYRVFFTNLNVKDTKDINEFRTNYSRASAKGFNRDIPSKIYSGKGRFNWAFHGSEQMTQTIASYIAFIDGQNPGTTVVKMFSGAEPTISNPSLTSHYPLKTIATKNRVQTFYKISSEAKLEQMANLIMRFINFVQTQKARASSNFETIRQIMPPPIKSAFEFIANNKITKVDLQRQVEAFNNGSHYMLAVEMFFRGMINVPSRLLTNFDAPVGVRLWLNFQGSKFKRMQNEIVGMANVNSIVPFVYIAYSSDSEDNNSELTIGHFNPATSKYNEPTTWMASFLKDLLGSQKTGKEISFYPL